ncbi:Gfo/Idh/MocA family oxidoreductase [Catenovulum sp. 2E275]|uniref:Gfo/Idh/MocA family protein n=1 Tax=Catenovulum sp. 2E275 TaxID=2980497 RepID=UPI0021D13A2E|nr:Gfo/Idh/MocA family oxidoreductase [Catenovulum sp. 2E275]MCU4674700.1 Gfo/Idh/MocA family oxidoreductase [Catenovulum sp. 2E275]
MSKIRMGMVGGGQGAFIGAVHRIAANIDGQIELVCGAFASNAEKSKASGQALFLPQDRVYGDYQTMFEQEAQLPADQRMQFVAIVTPNHMHYPVAKAALEAGFHVLSDKPATLNLDEVKSLKKIVEQTGLLYGLTHTYSGYPLVKHAQQMVANGEIGQVRKVMVEYIQGWLSEQESADNKQASWRTDPARSGISGCMGDIGSHAAHLAEYICGKQITHVCAELSTFVEGRRLDDDGIVLLKMQDGVKGTLQASQISAGEENNLTIRIYGEKAGLEWRQQEPNSLMVKPLSGAMQILRTGLVNSQNALDSTRTPAGHPEGYLEAFANIYKNFAVAVGDFAQGKSIDPRVYDFPSIDDGVRGMAIVQSFVDSSNTETKWFDIKPLLTD